MSSTIQELGPCKRKVTVTVDADAIEAAFKKNYREVRSTARIPGFRQGKVPMGVLEKRFGDQIRQDVKQELVIAAITSAYSEHTLEPVSEPDFSFEDIELDRGGDNLEFSFEVEIRPGFELPDCKGIEVTRTINAVTDERVEEILENIRRERSSWVPVEDEASQAKDLVTGHLQLMENDEEVFKRDDAHLEAGSSEKLIGSIPVDGIETLFVGVDQDQELSFEVKIPADYPVKDLQDKALEARFKVQEIKRMEIPELNDELAGQVGFDDLAALTAKIREDLAEHHKADADHQVQEDILDALISKVEIPIPESTLQKTLEGHARETIIQKMMRGEIAEADILKASEEIQEEARAEVERSIRCLYLVEKIAKQEKIFATESDFNARIEQIAMSQGKTPTAIREELAQNQMADRLRTDILDQKVRTWLTEQAKIAEESDGSAADASSAQAE